jgi:hypothetical protein
MEIWYHGTTSLSFLPLDEVENVFPLSPPVHEFEEAISLNDEEIEDPFKVTLASVIPAHEEKEIFILSHIDGFVKEPLDLVDDHI